MLCLQLCSLINKIKLVRAGEGHGEQGDCEGSSQWSERGIISLHQIVIDITEPCAGHNNTRFDI